jgi:glycosyltransferase involved in cell wall biosynthesis
MKILVVSPYLPWPLNSGGNAAQFSTLKCLAEDHEFTVVCPVYNREQTAGVAELSVRLPKVKWRGVYCDEEPLHPSLPFRILRRMIREGQKWLRPRASKIELPEYPFDPIPEPLLAAIQEELNSPPDLCQVEFAGMLSLGAWLPKGIPKLFIHHQLHFVFTDRFLETNGNNPGADYLAKMMRVQELGFLQCFDAVVTFSNEDRLALASALPAAKVFVSPFPIPADVGIAGEIPEKFDGRFLFVASELHQPNRDALDWLLAEIWPKIIAQRPAARLVVIGEWSAGIIKSKSGPSVSFTGFVPDLASTLRGGIMLVPVRIGSGLRVKILIAFAQGVPVVSTRVGSEGLLVQDGQELLVRTDASEFAAAAVELAGQPGLWRRLAVAGRAAVVKNYSAEEVRRRRNEIYETIMKER